VVEDAGGLRLYECFIDGAFAKAKSGAMGSVALESEGVKAMIRFDAKGLPGACSAPTNPAESHLIQQLFAFIILETTPPRVIGDKSYDSYRLDQFLAAQGVEMIAPNRLNRCQTQGGRRWDVTSCAGPSNAPLLGFKTTADFASAGKNLISPSKASFTWAALSHSSKRFWDSF
jgi:hypothetical protein